jgi:pimeloyl-ACP methyl ester carboxylesterase
VVLVQGGDTVNVSMLRNRMSTRFARRLAGQDYHVLRFDYRGLGESSGENQQLDLDDPLELDAIEAAAYLRSVGCTGIVMVGACFSGRTALAAAPSIPDVVGVVMSTPPLSGFKRGWGLAEQMAREQDLGSYARRAMSKSVLTGLLKPGRRQLYRKLAVTKLNQLRGKAKPGADETSWVSRPMLDALEDTIRREVPVLIVYGADDPFLREYDRAARGRLGVLVSGSKGVVDLVRDVPGELHGFPTIAGQETFMDLTEEWIERRCRRA